MVRMWVAGKTVIPYLIRAISDHFRDAVLYNKVLYKLGLTLLLPKQILPNYRKRQLAEDTRHPDDAALKSIYRS